MLDLEHLQKQTSILMNLYNSKRFEDVIQKGKILLKKYPDQIILYNAISLSLSSINKDDEALDILKQALALQPNNIFVLNNLGLINGKLEKDDLSKKYYEKALSINNNFIDALVNLGNLELRENKPEKSEQYLKKALGLSKAKETDELIYMALGNYNQQIGNFKEAKNNFEMVNKINKHNSTADKSISLIHKYLNNEDPHLLSMEAKLKNNANNENLRSINFALGKAYEDIKDYKKSFNYLKAANKIADKEINYNINGDINLFEEIKNLFKNFQTKNTITSDKRIIFIVGMPRSGTTLAEQILSAHKDVYGAGELKFLGEAIKKNLLKDNKFVNISDKNLVQIQNEYLDKIESLNYKENVLTDKAPLNFKWIGFIRIIFPNAKIVHCDRDAMDICFSNFKNSFQSYSLAFCYDLKKLGKFYNLYKSLMDFWINKYSDQIYNLSYEKLINDQKQETEKLLSFCNLDWDENCLSPHKNKKTVATASLAQVRSPIYSSSIKKWEKFSDELSELKKIILKS